MKRKLSKIEAAIRGLELEKGILLTEEERVEFEKAFEEGVKIMKAKRTQRELRTESLDHLHHLVDYWSNLPGVTKQEAVDGIAFSILSSIDGESSTPGLFLKTKEYDICINEGVHLHEFWHK